tara:strand:- start:1431 stop:1850 length:420 start_codon:yes stop_codon:yes gene_type:complete
LIEDDLRAAGLRVTKARVMVLAVFHRASLKQHLTAEDVYRELLTHEGSVGLGTIYRVLTQLDSAGLLERHHFEDGGAVYELASEIHHDHMIDVDTGEVIEFVSEPLESLQLEIADQKGVELINHQLIMWVRQRPADGSA